eukprot:CAMPEP_0197837404 /NCGR_PEP_ID=MMETSP1437-20131217/32050_1 /TAXON_ID=49252 ORGANISM="Eucampia antarctica, Strain CCMP1452" /NCGR_SAMPLE_ID=MMETSP1437 /ASSEMBLY_ACC=CAM_ASM_001096 /LENGTH=432 /DNA_ID=CAMNT_0043444421 /DNA_START=559 /DNA_END=1857 /DNA_ORIENTATION=-
MNTQSIFTILFFVIQTFRLLISTDGLSSLDKRSARDLSANLLAGLKGRTSSESKLLNLETDFYDQSTGLYSEGVWHNALVGISSLENDQSADQIADSLFKYSWDGCSFRRRSWSGNWDHSNIDSNNPPEQANYYRESSEYRCVQHGIALVFWSKLLLDRKAGQDVCISREKYQEQQKLIAECFIREFYDSSVQRWTTVSRSQGGGSLLRPSVSAAKQTLGATEETPYYRAVDQAMAVLACLEHLKLLEQDKGNDALNTKRTMLIELIQTTCFEILSPNGFGYGNIKEAKSYVGLDRNRNFWHDGWTFLSLIKASEYLWPLDTNHGEAQLDSIWQGLTDMYGNNDGTVWHWERALKNDSSNVRYCGDNALAHAIERNLKLGRHNTQNMEGDGFWKFIASLREGHGDGLASVADVYTQVRLHPNTELSALLVWP